MKLTDAPIPLFGGVWDTTNDEAELIADVDNSAVVDALERMLAGYELMTTFSVYGAGFTAPKGKIKLSFEVDSYLLERVMPLVRHTGDRLLLMVWTPEPAFSRVGVDGGDER